MPLKDPVARRKYHRDYMRRKFREDPIFKKAHLARVRSNNDKYNAESAQVISAFRRNGCGLCPEKEACCLDAHHPDPTKKDLNIGDFRKYSPKRIAAELRKCVCLCKNCHAKVHAGLVDCSGVEQPGSSSGS